MRFKPISLPFFLIIHYPPPNNGKTRKTKNKGQGTKRQTKDEMKKEKKEKKEKKGSNVDSMEYSRVVTLPPPSHA